MKFTWKHDKGTGNKREQRFRLERQQLRKTFAANMERVDVLCDAYCSATDVAAVNTGDLEQKFVEWAFAKYRHRKFKEPLSEEHLDMAETWREIVVTTEACKTATAARMEANRVKKQKRMATAIMNRFVD